MKDKFIKLYLNIASEVAKMSYARRLQVGAVIVKEDRIISMGYNGTPSGWDNNCEDQIYEVDGAEITLKTKPEVLHAEMNALMKLAKMGGTGGDRATMFLTHSPCLECAKGIYQAGIRQVYFRHNYRSTDGIEFLQKCRVGVDQDV